VQKQLNRAAQYVLPPEVQGNTYGHLFVEIGNLEWLIYNQENYLDERGMGVDDKGVHSLFCNIKFWGDKSKGVYLKYASILIW